MSLAAMNLMDLKYNLTKQLGVFMFRLNLRVVVDIHLSRTVFS